MQFLKLDMNRRNKNTLAHHVRIDTKIKQRRTQAGRHVMKKINGNAQEGITA